MGCMISRSSTNEVTNNDRHRNVVGASEGQPQAQSYIAANSIVGATMDGGTANGNGADATIQADSNTTGGTSQVRDTPNCTACYISLELMDVIEPQCEHTYCRDCIKSMFTSACKDETRMPPRCCTVIPLSFALPYLTNQEATLYREKFEEWHTADRVYCPVQTCSAFIPSRLLPTPPASPKPIIPEDTEMAGLPQTDDTNPVDQDKERVVVTFGTGVVMEVHEVAPMQESTPMQASDSKGSHASSEASNNSAISCPKCEAAICVSCKRLSHPDTPCEGSEEWITEFLRKYKLKRCPKCRNAVKKMFGCDHIRCRCGAQWCWACCKRIVVCENEGCDGDEHDQLEDAEGDLDAGDWQYEDFANIGDEPDQNILDPWNCEHSWRKVRRTTGEPEPLGMVCYRCTRELCADPRPAPDDIAPTAQTTGQSSRNQPIHEEVEVDEDKVAWHCDCALFVCRSCVSDPETLHPADAPHSG
ncbi:hypothetical protein GP486_005622 [Trichoglossum hirsutum]|uniref:RING-type domain-containing protein n=1 Tax=Trichoglossum hirsutum TaxID=265104 RepID=A0A9P8L919_9PEZI|nr:hypothetical protein GP486_005622 [Trichoglossum hirsutum]